MFNQTSVSIKKLPVALAISALFTMGSAHAAVVYTDNFSYLGALTSPNSISTSFSSPIASNAATLSFDLVGYASLDGQNCCTDVFTLTTNGTDVLSGTFNMGGGGSSLLFNAPFGTTWSTASNGLWQGGLTQITVPFALLAGTNTLQFSYSGVYQGLSDEGWGLHNVTVTAPVPEPETYAMLLAGLGLIGFAARRRKNLTA